MIPKPHRRTVTRIAIAIALAWLVVLGVTLFVFFRTCETTAAKWGQFGDAFGIVNALFTGLGLLGAIVAILLQGEQVKQQQKELEAQRADLDESNKLQKVAAQIQKESARLLGLQVRVAALSELLRAWDIKSQQLESKNPARHSNFNTGAGQAHAQAVKDLEDERNGLIAQIAECEKQIGSAGGVVT